MSLKIDQDHSRFRAIVRGKIRQNLRRYISQGELIGRKGKELVSIPIPQIDIPRFIYGDKQRGGVGQGKGDVGDPVGGQESEGDDGAGHAGQDAGDHVVEVDVTLDELADILGEELELPAIENKGKNRIVSAKDRYTGIRRVGPDSLKHFKRTYKEALRRALASGIYDPKEPIIVPQHDDRRFRSWKEDVEPVANAVIIYMMDVSGSMGDEQKEIVRVESFWIDTWIQTNYNGVVTRYIIHDAVAQEVDKETFFHTRESGGTVISSAYELCNKIIEEEYPQDLWNIYVFHFSDGDNWSGGDTDRCIHLLKGDLLPKVNLFGYGQVESTYGSGQFIRELENNVHDIENMVLSRIENKDDIYQSIKDFLGKGK
jgi:uncharacterized protein